MDKASISAIRSSSSCNNNPNLLRRSPLLDLPVIKALDGHRDLVHVQDTWNIGQVIEVMAKEHVVAVPIVASNGHWVGIADLLDFYRYFRICLCNSNTFFDTKIRDMLRFCLRPAIRLRHSCSLGDVTELFGAGVGFHRIGINTSPTTLTSSMSNQHNVVCQCDVVALASEQITSISTNCEWTKSWTENMTAETLQWTDKDVNNTKVVALDAEKSSVKDALDAMVEMRVSCVGALHKNKHLTGSFSLECLKRLGKQLFHESILHMNLGSFLLQGAPPPVHIEKHQPFADVVETFVEKKTHQLWVTQDRIPSGVVTLTDVIGALHSNSTNGLGTQSSPTTPLPYETVLLNTDKKKSSDYGRGTEEVKDEKYVDSGDSAASWSKDELFRSIVTGSSPYSLKF